MNVLTAVASQVIWSYKHLNIDIQYRYGHFSRNEIVDILIKLVFSKNLEIWLKPRF